MAKHLAAVAVAKGEPFQIQSRPTPKPGPGELLIEVKSVAINPADGIMQSLGLLIPSYPAVIGFDVSGQVLEVGEGVPVDVPDRGGGPVFRPGLTRVAAYAAAVWRPGNPDYGAFQERCLVPWQHAVPLPDDSISWNQAATLPVAVQVPLCVWDALGIPRSISAGASAQRDGKQGKEALLIWGASSSVGTMGVQSARLLREDGDSAFAAVYATAGAANLKYVQSLGADRVFDYKEPKITEAIISAAREDGLVVRHCFLAMGELAKCQTVLKAFVDEQQTSKVGSAPPLPADAEQVPGMDAIFVQPSMTDERERLAQFRYWFGTWLHEQLVKGSIKPSPQPEVVGKGLQSVNAACEEIMTGVSCTKLVVEVGE